MKEVKFKAGDLVYCPSVSPNIFKLLEVYDSQLKIKTPLRLVNIDRDIAYFLTPDGFDLRSEMPLICYATQQNYERLSATFPNVEFEPPPKRKEPREIIEAMLESGKWQDVPYIQHYLDDVKKGILEKKDLKYLTSESKHILIQPYDPKTGKTIIDFVDGEVVLENKK